MHILTVKNYKSLQEYLFWISFILYIIFTTLSYTFFFTYYEGVIYKMIILFCMLCLVIREISLDFFSSKLLIPFALCLIVAVIFAKNAPQIMYISIPMYIFSARNISFRKIALVTAYIQAAILAVTVICSQTGLITDYFEMWFGRTRHYLGFYYSLYGPTLLYNIIAVYLYAKGREVRWFVYVLLGAVDYLLYVLTDSRLTFITSMVLIVISLLYRIFPKVFQKLGIINWLCVIAFPVCGIGSIILTSRYQPFGRMKRLNSFLGDRLYYGYNSLRRYGISFLGQKINWIGNGLRADGTSSSQVRTYVDNLYQQDMQRYGLLFLIIALVVLTVFSYKCYKKKDYLMLYILALAAIHAILDDLVFFICFNTFWLAIIPVIHPELAGAPVTEIKNRREKCTLTGNCKYYSNIME
ncbi:MAG: hypothetical protein ACI4ET_05295 [Bilifractor sp.]